MTFYTRYYQIADITIKVESELPFTETTFLPKFRLFEINEPGRDVISLRHYFDLPDTNTIPLGKEIYRKAPWAIFKTEDSWIYANISNNIDDKNFYRIAIFDLAHSKGTIYHRDRVFFQKGNLNAISLLPTDQILIARILADRDACYFHSSGARWNGSGYLFVGHSEAGKSTILKLLQPQAQSLCDDRIILRKYRDEYRIFGTWSGGEEDLITATSAPVKAVFFLNKSQENRLDPVVDKKHIMDKLLACLIRPLITSDWWEKTLDLIQSFIRDVPVYDLHFDKSGRIAEEIERL
jgi:hypothetical protein